MHNKNVLYGVMSIILLFFTAYFIGGAPGQSVENNAFFDSGLTDTHVSYLYAPGMMGTEFAMIRYCPEFTAVTGEKLSADWDKCVIGHPHTAVVFPEIDLRKPSFFTLNPITALINGVRQDIFPLAQRFLDDMYDIHVVDNPESKLSVINYGFNFGKANIGQRRDIRCFSKAYRAHLKKYPDTQIIAYGDSRGAATIFNFIARHKPTHIKAAVLDGIFDTVEHCVNHFMYSDKDTHVENRLHDIVSWVMRSYRKNGICPRQCVEIIGDEVPLLMVISLKDGLVAPQGALYLYNRLRERGHQKVHLLVLKNALHPSYMIDNPEDSAMYEHVVHAFYKHYGLPYNSKKALAGHTHFLATQPSAQELTELYQLPECHLCTVCAD